MEKKELMNVLNEVFEPIGFKKKGNYWVINGNEITKVVNLQKSEYSNRFYINYGYIINAVPLDTMMHIYKRVASSNNNENKRIDELLDLENGISNENRRIELKNVLVHQLVSDILSINTQEDILNELKTRPHLNNIPLVVKKHFQLE